MRIARLLLLLALAAGCAERVALPQIKVDDSAPLRWSAALEKIARNGRNQAGGVDFEALAQDPSALQRYQVWVARHGPESDPMKESWEEKRLAFLINAYNAELLAGVLHLGRPASLAPGGAVDLFHDLAWRVDREWITLSLLHEERIRGRFQEPLVHLALYTATRDSPPLRYWASEGLYGALARQAARFLASDRGLRPVGDGFEANPLFFKYEKDFIEWGEAETLCRWMLKYARGERETWLRANAVKCPLRAFPEDHSLDQALAGDGEEPAAPEEEAPPDPAPPAVTVERLDE